MCRALTIRYSVLHCVIPILLFSQFLFCSLVSDYDCNGRGYAAVDWNAIKKLNIFICFMR